MGTEIAGVPNAVYGAFVLGSPADAKPNGAGPVALQRRVARVPFLRMEDDWQHVQIALHALSAKEFWVAPIETVSESEEGFECVYQGSQILAVWHPASPPKNPGPSASPGASKLFELASNEFFQYRGSVVFLCRRFRLQLREVILGHIRRVFGSHPRCIP